MLDTSLKIVGLLTLFVLNLTSSQDLAGRWSDWTSCTVTCGRGEQTRTRWHIDEFKRNRTESQSVTCRSVECQVLTRWLPWTECDKDCGGGHRTRQLKDVSLFDNKTMTQWDFLMRCNNNRCGQTHCSDFDLVFLLDSSGSIGEPGWWLVKQLAIDVVRSMHVNKTATHVGLVTYSSTPEVNFDLDAYTESKDVQDAIWRAEFLSGATGTADGILEARKMFRRDRGDRPDKQNILVWITDGVSNIDEKRTVPEATAAKRAGIHIIALGIGYYAELRELNEVASNPISKNVIKVDRISELQGILPSLAGGVCKGPTNYTYFNQEGYICCSHSGDPHTRTFDGMWIHHQGKCKYNLATPSDGTFKVQTRHERRYGNTYVSYTKYVEIHYKGQIVRLDKGGKLLINGRETKVPYQWPDGRVARISDGLLRYEIPDEVQVTWDGNAAVQVCISERHTDGMTGICGNADGDRWNDLDTSRGERVRDDWNGYATLGDSWQVFDPEERSCLSESFRAERCSSENEEIARRRQYCGLLTEQNGPFSQCMALVPAQGYMRSCIFDVCSNIGNLTLMRELSCQSLKVLERECQAMRVPVGVWANVPGCDTVPPVTIFPPVGVRPTPAGVTKAYPYRNGLGYMCCTHSGDSHTRTFDGAWIHYGGDCKYNLASPRDRTFMVHVKQTPRPGNPSKSYASYFDVIYQNRVIRLKRGSTFTVDGQDKNAPYIAGDVTVKKDGTDLTYSLPDYFEVTYDGSFATTVCVHERFRGEMTGLCGNADGDLSNDFLSGNNQQLPEGWDGYRLVGEANQVLDKEDPDCQNGDNKQPECASDAAATARDDSYCGLLLRDNGPFGRCLSKIPSKGHQDSCLFDVCTNTGSSTTMRELSCGSLDLISRECIAAGVPVPSTLRQLLNCPDEQGGSRPTPAISLTSPRPRVDNPFSFINDAGYVCCSVSGDPHFRTFDGSFISYQGACKYNMATPTDNNFQVHVKHERRSGNTYVSYVKYVDIIYQGRTYRLDQNQVLKVNGVPVSIPFTRYGVNARRRYNGRFLVFEIPGYLQVQWDGNNALYTCVEEQYRSSMSGLCGNFDGDRFNDFVTSAGSRQRQDLRGYQRIGDSWQVVDPEEPNCVNGAGEAERRRCSLGAEARARQREYCGLLFANNGPFRECLQTIRTAKGHQDSCVYDVCSNDGKPNIQKEVACRALRVMADECEAARARLPDDWYQQAGCTEQGEVAATTLQPIGPTAGPGGRRVTPDISLSSPRPRVQNPFFFVNDAGYICCSSSGDPHVRTFDGSFIIYQGACKYNMATPNDNNFQVHVKHERRNGNTYVSYVKYVDVIYQGRTYRLDRNQVLKVNGVPVSIPFTRYGVDARRKYNGRFLVFEIPGYLQVQWDGNNAVYVCVEEQYQSSMSGLCGNFDGDRSNDFVTSSGGAERQDLRGYQRIGDSWQVRDPEEPNCVNGAGSAEWRRCSLGAEARARQREYCGLLFASDGPFRVCLQTIRTVKGHQDSCVYDVCSYDNKPNIQKEMACRSLRVVADECEAARARLPDDWYQQAGCTEQGEVAGTTQPTGQPGERRVRPEVTPRPGDQNPFNFINDAGYVCCSSSGDPHVRTFDGSFIIYQGACKYNLATPTDNNFQVHVKHERRNGNTYVSYVKYVDVIYQGRTYRLDQNQVLKVNGVPVSIPFNQYGVDARRKYNGRFLVLEIPGYLQVQWDGNNAVYACVEEQYRSSMSGLCGNFDGDRFNDFVTSSGRVERQDLRGYQKIGDSWQVVDPEEPNCVNGATEAEWRRCSLGAEAEARQREYCGLLFANDGPFRQCLQTIRTAKGHQDSCVYDVCSNDGKPNIQKEVACRALRVMADECEAARARLPDDWYQQAGCTEQGEVAGTTPPTGQPGERRVPPEISLTSPRPRVENPFNFINDAGYVCCSASGDPHFRTFDGSFIIYQGACKYNLATPTDNNFQVHVKHERRNGNTYVSYVKYVDIIYQGRTYRLDQNQVLKVNGVPVSIPFNQYGVNARRKYNGRFLVLEIPGYLQVQWDGNNAVYACVEEQYRSSMSGMCGNFDGDRSNDFVTSTGTVERQDLRGYQRIGDSWQVVDPEEPNCVNGAAAAEQRRCSQGAEATARGREYCGLLFANNGPFRDCLQTIRTAQGHRDSCVYDVCSNDGKPNIQKVVACRSLRVVADECEAARARLPEGWYQQAGCTAQGGVAGTTLQPSGRPTPPSPQSFQVLNDHGYTCCGISGDPHVRTFDGTVISYQGGCKYNLATPTDEAFRVHVRHERRDGRQDVSYVGYLDVLYQGNTYRLDKRGVLKVNGRQVQKPYNRGGVRGYQDGAYTIVEIPGYVQVQFDGYAGAYACVSDRYKGEMSGLCANFDNNRGNDLVTSRGRLVANNLEGHRQLGDSWQVTDDEDPNCVNNAGRGRACSAEADRLARTPRYCGLLLDTNGPFRECLPRIPAKGYQDSCVFDVCQNAGSATVMRELACGTLWTVANECRAVGVQLPAEWATPLNCPAETRFGRLSALGGPELTPGPTAYPLSTSGGYTCCSSSGDPHVRTFDGSFIHYQGGCKYNLATPSDNRFQVHVRHERRNGRNDVAYVGYVDVYYQGRTYRLDQAAKGFLKVNGHSMTIPYNQQGVSARWRGRFLILEVPGVFQIQWDGVGAVYACVPQNYTNEMTGICGNFDGDRMNDFTTADGIRLRNDEASHRAIGDSHQVRDDEEPNCQSLSAGPAVCRQDVLRRAQRDDYCGLILNENGPFGACVERIPAQGYLESCLFDVCANDGSYTVMKELACGAIYQVASECRAVGINLPANWHRLANCPKEPSAPPREVTAPRMYHFINDDGYTCCSISGDPHVRTFDGAFMHYQGQCKYNLATPKSQFFKVQTRHERRHANSYVSYVSYVDVIYNNKTYRLDKYQTLRVDGVPTPIPYNSNGVVVGRRGLYLTLEIPNYVQVQFDGDAAAYACVTQRYRTSMTGLCGNFDGDLNNDFLTAGGALMKADEEGLRAIGNSWQVYDPEDPQCLNGAVALQVCSLESMRSARSQQYCGLLTDRRGPFALCLDKIPFQGHFDSCVFDVCSNSESVSLMRELACAALWLVDEACRNARYRPGDWQRYTGCRQRVAITASPLIYTTPVSVLPPARATPLPGSVVEAVSWTNWSTCSRSCGGGAQERVRWLYSSTAKRLRLELQKVSCNSMSCASLSRWNRWSSCSRSCGGGLLTRTLRDPANTDKRTLLSSDFSMSCNNNPCQKLTNCGPSDIVLLLDSSASMGDAGWWRIKQLAIDVVRSFVVSRQDTQFALVIYSSTAKTVFNLNRYSSSRDIQQAIWSTKFMSGATATAFGLREARLAFHQIKGDRLWAKNIIVWITDGVSNVDTENTLAEGELIRKEGITVISVPVGVLIRRTEVDAVSSPPIRLNVIPAARLDQVHRVTSRLVHTICRSPINLPYLDDQGYSCCRISGDPHVRTFDGSWIHYQGACKYNLASPVNKLFKVEVRQESRNGMQHVYQIGYVEITHQNQVIRLGRNQEIEINARKTTLPPSGKLNTPDGNSIENINGELVYKLPNHVTVRYDGHHFAHVCIHKRYLGSMTGLCGNADQDRFNDFLTSNNTLTEDDNRGYQAIGDSWQVVDEESVDCESNPALGQECGADSIRMAQRGAYCGQLLEKNGPFGACLPRVPALGHGQACQADVCKHANSGSLMKAEACNALYALEAECKAVGAAVQEWDYATRCGDGVWDEWGNWSTCSATCRGTQYRYRRCLTKICPAGARGESRFCGAFVCQGGPEEELQ